MGFLDRINSDDLENAQSFSSFTIGDNLAKIAEVKEDVSKNGNDTLVITFINDSGAKIRYYIVDNEYMLQKLKSFYVAFGIPFTEKNYQRWIGKKGIVVCKEGKPYNGETRSEVSYVRPITSGEQPARQTFGKPPANTPAMYSEPEQNNNPVNDGFDDDIPF